MLQYNEKDFFCAKTVFLNFKITLPLTRLDMVSSRLLSNGLICLDDIPVDIQLVTFYCYPILVS